MPPVWRIHRAAKAYGQRSSRDSLRRRLSWLQAEPTVQHFQEHIAACSRSDSDEYRKTGLSTSAVIFQHTWSLPSPEFSWQANGFLAMSSSIGGFSTAANPLWFAEQNHGSVLRKCSRRTMRRTQASNHCGQSSARRFLLQLDDYGPPGSWTTTRLGGMLVGSEEARLHAGLRPPLKLHVRFSRMQLSRRRKTSEMPKKEWKGTPLGTRQVDPSHQSPRTR